MLLKWQFLIGFVISCVNFYLSFIVDVYDAQCVHSFRVF